MMINSQMFSGDCKIYNWVANANLTTIATTSVAGLVAFIYIISDFVQSRRKQRLLAKFKRDGEQKDEVKPFEAIPGPKIKYPLIGNVDQFWERGVPVNHALYRRRRTLAAEYRDTGMYRLRLGPLDTLWIFKAE